MRRPSTRVSSSRVACGRSDDVAAKHLSRQHRRAGRVPSAWCRAPSTGGWERRRRLPPERRPPLRSRPKLSSRQREASRREVGGRRSGCAARSRSKRQWMSPGRDNGENALAGARGGTPWPARPECRLGATGARLWLSRAGEAEAQRAVNSCALSPSESRPELPRQDVTCGSNSVRCRHAPRIRNWYLEERGAYAFLGE